MTITEDLKTFVVASTSIQAYIGGSSTSNAPARMFQNKIPEGADTPLIAFIRTGSEDVLTLDGVGGSEESRYDVECTSTSIDSADDLAEAVKDRLHGYSGSFGDSTAQVVLVDDHDDTYVNKAVPTDLGLHTANLEVRIFHK